MEKHWKNEQEARPEHAGHLLGGCLSPGMTDEMIDHMDHTIKQVLQ